MSISDENLGENEKLRRRWLSTMNGFGLAKNAAEPIFCELVTAYSQPHRFYHNLRHIEEMLDVVDGLQADRYFSGKASLGRIVRASLFV